MALSTGGKSWISRGIGKLKTKVREQRLNRSAGLAIRTGPQGTTIVVKKAKGAGGGGGAVWL